MEEPNESSLNLIDDVNISNCNSNEDHSNKTSKRTEQSTSTTSFECNICFENAQEPVVTRCGHLYCWGCICLWLDRGYGDCPVCKAGVTQENVIPLYGRGSDNCDPRKKTKPRPKAERPEARQREQNTNGPQRIFQNAEFTFGVPNISLITMFANPLGAVLSLGIAQRFFYNELQTNTRHSSSEEFRSQLISNISLLIGIVIMLYLLFLE